MFSRLPRLVTPCIECLGLNPDIIALLIVGVILVAAFFFWEHHVIHTTTQPPLMRLALWTRAKGKLAAVYAIGFMSFMGFVVRFYYRRQPSH